MKKFRILLSLICSLIMCFSAFGLLTACTSLGDDESNKAKTLGDAISGIIVLYQPEAGSEEDVFVDGFAGGEKSFATLLDRQLSMMADDILVRLNAIYGNGLSNESFILTDKDENPVMMGITPATSYKKDTLSIYGSGYKLADGTAASLPLNLNDAGSLALGLFGNDGTGIGNISYSSDASTNTSLSKNFNLADTISGKHATRGAGGVLSFSDGGTSWNWGNQSFFVTGDENVTVGDYKNYLRMALSDILANGYDYSETKAYTDYTFDQSKYDENLKKIDHLGIGTGDADIVKKFIKYGIIGKTLIDADNLALETLATKTSIEAFNYEIQTGYSAEMDATALAELNSLNNIKFYETIVNGMVDSMATNTFSSGVALIYPQMPRLKTQYVSYAMMDDEENPYWTKEGMNVKNVILMPKTECRLDVLTFVFQQKTDLTQTYYATVNVNFVVKGYTYYGTVEATINPGEIPPHNDEEHDTSNNSTSGSYNGGNTPPEQEDPDPLMANETGVEIPDIIAPYAEEEGTTGDVWEVFSGAASTDFTTVSNPFTLQQTTLDEGGKISASTASFYDAGNNYLEITFEFFTKDDNDLLVPCNTMPPYSFRISNEWSSASFGDDLNKSPDEMPEQPTEFGE